MAYHNHRLAGTFMLIAFGVSAIASAQTPPTLYARLGGGCTHGGDVMRAREVPLAARNQLLEILAPMNRDVVKL